MDRPLYRIGTRGSRLALVQAESVANALRQQNIHAEIVIISTKGDREHDVKLSSLGGVGAFTKEIQHALLDQEIDLAVHSLKDLPTTTHEGLQLAAVPPRANVHDIAVIHPKYKHWNELPKNAVVGTGSLRRAAQLSHQSPQFQIQTIRGNVETRLKKLEQQPFDAIILAAAGLERLGYHAHISHQFHPLCLCPAAGQGAIGIEIRNDDDALKIALHTINHPLSMTRVTAERALLRTLGAGCSAPVAVLAVFRSVDHDHELKSCKITPSLRWNLDLMARVLSSDGKIALEMKDSIELDDEKLSCTANTSNATLDNSKIHSNDYSRRTTHQHTITEDALGETPSAWLNTAEKLGISVAKQLIQLGANILLKENAVPIV